MVYIYYNLQLWVRQLQKTLDVEDNIDSTVGWRVETERHVMDSIPNWLDVDPKALEVEEVAIAREGEPEVEEEEEQGQEAEQVKDEEEGVTTSRMRSNRGQRPPLFFASRGQKSPFVAPGTRPSSSRGKGKVVPYSRKGGRGYQ